MSADLEHILIHEKSWPALEGFEKLIPAQKLTLTLEENGDVLACLNEGGEVSVVRLDEAALAAIGARHVHGPKDHGDT